MTEANEKHSVRVDLMMTASEVHAIEEWRRKELDLPTRAEAIRRLIQFGLAASVKAPQTRLSKRGNAPMANRGSDLAAGSTTSPRKMKNS